MAECILMKAGSGTGSDECTATKGNVLAGKTAVTSDSDDEAVAGTMPNKGAWTSRIGVNGKAVIPAGYHNGAGYVDQAITNRGAVNTALGINGTYTIPEGYHNGAGKVTQNIATMGAQTVTPGNSQKVVSCSGKYMTGNVTVQAVSNLIAANIKKGVVVGGVTGTWEGYVANPTDLYYNGINNAGFRVTGGILDSNQITMNFGSNSLVLTSNIAYNLTGYSKVIVEGSFKNYASSKNVQLNISNDAATWTKLGGIDYTGVYTSFTWTFNYQGTVYIRLFIPQYNTTVSDGTATKGYVRHVYMA